VGQDVEVTDGDDHAFCDGYSNRIVNETCDYKDVYPCVTAREDHQLRTIVLVDNNLTNQQTNNYPKLLKDIQFQLNLALSQLDILMKSKPHLNFNQLDVLVCFISQAQNCITNVDWLAKNLNTQLAITRESIFTN
jgi:hypothetical protein